MITAEWSESTGRVFRTTAVSESNGSYRLCELPSTGIVRRHGETKTQQSASIPVQIDSDRLLMTMDILLSERGVAGYSLSGIVFGDSLSRPLAGAQVLLHDVAKSAVTDGSGAFHFDSIHPGDHQLLVRRIGYGPLDTTLTLEGNETRQIVLTRIATQADIQPLMA